MKKSQWTYSNKTNSFLSMSLLLIMFMTKFSFSQDIHFSNWNMSPLNVNPAYTGMFDGNGRLIFNYRNQWQNVQVPYNTISFGADFNLNKSLIKKTKESVGIIFNKDGAGDGRYQINELKIPIGHKISFKNDTNLTISLGVLAGITNISIDPNKLSYDKQWDGDAYNRGISNGEFLQKQSKVFGDVSLGTAVQKKFTQNFSITLSYGISHINKPNISFNNTAGVTLKPKHNESLLLKYSFSNISGVTFEYYANQQQAFRENLTGLTYYYTVEPKTNIIVNAGVLTRINDALITTVGLQYQTTRLQLSYDYNYSKFKRATGGRGGFELSLIYIYAKPKMFVPKSRVCPIYM